MSHHVDSPLARQEHLYVFQGETGCRGIRNSKRIFFHVVEEKKEERRERTPAALRTIFLTDMLADAL